MPRPWRVPKNRVASIGKSGDWNRPVAKQDPPHMQASASWPGERQWRRPHLHCTSVSISSSPRSFHTHTLHTFTFGFLPRENYISFLYGFICMICMCMRDKRNVHSAYTSFRPFLCRDILGLTDAITLCLETLRQSFRAFRIQHIVVFAPRAVTCHDHFVCCPQRTSHLVLVFFTLIEPLLYVIEFITVCLRRFHDRAWRDESFGPQRIPFDSTLDNPP